MIGEHARLVAACDLLCASSLCEDRDFATRFHRFEADLIAHLDTEERRLLPSYAQTDPADAHAVQRAHAQVRRLVREIGAELARHQLHHSSLHALRAGLQALIEHEEAGLYGAVAVAGLHP